MFPPDTWMNFSLIYSLVFLIKRDFDVDLACDIFLTFFFFMGIVFLSFYVRTLIIYFSTGIIPDKFV